MDAQVLPVGWEIDWEWPLGRSQETWLLYLGGLHTPRVTLDKLPRP